MRAATTSSAVTLAIGGLIALVAAMGIGRFVYTPILPYMADGLGLTKSEAGLIASANFLGYLLGALAAAFGSWPGGRRLWFLGGLLASALTTAAMGLADGFWAFAALRFAAGLASALALVFSVTLILDRLAARGRSELSAVYFAGVGCGIALSAMLTAVLASAGYGWRVHWLAAGAISLAAYAAVLLLVPGGGDGPGAPEAAADRATGRRLRAQIAAYGLFGFGYVITMTFISVIVRSDPAISHLESLAWLAVGLAAIPSIWFWNWMAGRIGSGRSFAIACIAECAGVALSVLFTGAVAILLAAVLVGGTFMGITSLGLYKARELTRGDVRKTMALMTASFGLGQMIGPGLAGAVVDATGSFLLPSLAGSAALLAAGFLGIYAAGPPRTNR